MLIHFIFVDNDMLHFIFLSDHKVLMSSFHLKIRQGTCSCNAIEFIVFSCTAIVLCRREREDIGLNTTLLKLFLTCVLYVVELFGGGDQCNQTSWLLRNLKLQEFALLCI